MVKSLVGKYWFNCAVKESTTFLMKSSKYFRILKMVLAIPSGTVDVERSFSVTNHIKTGSNSLLSLQHLEDRIRLSINSTDNLQHLTSLLSLQHLDFFPFG